MKRLCPLMVLLCLLLCGCTGRKQIDSYESFAQKLREREKISFTADIRAEFEDHTAEFSLSCSADKSGCTVEILKPENVAGVKAHIKAGETALEYEGIMLGTGRLDYFGLSPMTALPELLKAMDMGYVNSYWSEEGRYYYELLADDEHSAVLCFEIETMTPLSAELISGGQVKVYCDINSWS